jgi:outer membrane protein TolC
MDSSRWSIPAALLFAALLAPSAAHAEDGLENGVDRASVVAAAVRASPGLRAAGERVRAAHAASEAEGHLPPPEAMLQVWGVPLSKPLAIDESQMIMAGLGQTFPAFGSRGARERAGERAADVERAAADDRARLVRREAEHAFADYVEATAHHRIHLEHRSIASRALSVAQARLAAGASLTDVTQAEVELARIDSDVVTQRARIDGAAARINVLVLRDAAARLGPAAIGEAETSALDLRAALAKARESRPELRVASSRREELREVARAAEQEAKLPTFSVAALYFAPTVHQPEHGYGMNASMSLPWLWGEAASKRDARRKEAEAAASEASAAHVPIDAEVASAEAAVRASALRVQALRDRALPASRRALDVAWAGYQTGKTDMLTLLSAQRSVVDVERDLVEARASLDHALAELDAAVGAEVPRRPLGPLDTRMIDGGGHGE